MYLLPCKTCLTEVPGFTPKRIYLENIADRSKSPATSSATPAQSTKGLFGIKWGFDQGGAKKWVPLVRVCCVHRHLRVLACILNLQWLNLYPQLETSPQWERLILLWRISRFREFISVSGVKRYTERTLPLLYISCTIAVEYELLKVPCHCWKLCS